MPNKNLSPFKGYAIVNSPQNSEHVEESAFTYLVLQDFPNLEI